LILFYNLFIRLYVLGIRLVAPWNRKASLWLKGRKDQQRNHDPYFEPGSKVIWMHCASLGEFEQGRPVLEALKSQHPEYKILLTFFSPSGYEIRKDYQGADKVLYLPMGTRASAKSFIQQVNPSLVLWVKYEYWYHYLVQLKQRNIPVILFSAIFRPAQPFFKWYGSLHREMLSCFRALFVQDRESVELLNSIGITQNLVVAGDTRFDRVIQIAEQSREIPAIDYFTNGQQCIVAGSTWKEDEEELVHFARINPHVKFIIAPHQVEEERILEIERLFPHTIRYSIFQNGHPDPGAQTLIIDNIGMLSSLYRYATVCYVGGGFGDDGVHNILEAAVYGKAVVFGPVYEKYREAVGMVEAGGAFPVQSALELESTLQNLLQHPEPGQIAGEYVYRNSGATAQIIEKLKDLV
jgi:3-deoxy-D-manno-octulosonic-acid transferase